MRLQAVPDTYHTAFACRAHGPQAQAEAAANAAAAAAVEQGGRRVVARLPTMYRDLQVIERTNYTQLTCNQMCARMLNIRSRQCMWQHMYRKLQVACNGVRPAVHLSRHKKDCLMH